jgi:PAS domain S-box-containing protein
MEIQEMLNELLARNTELETQNKELLNSLKKMQESRDCYFELFDHAPVGYVTVNTRGLIVEVNTTASKMLGSSRDQLVGLPLMSFVHRKDLDKYYFHRKELFKNRLLGAVQSTELRLIKSDGTSFWAWLEATAIQEAQGSIVCRVVINDIGIRKEAQESLHFERSQLLSIFDSINEFIFVSDPETYEILYVNRYMKDVLSKELVGGICYQELHNRTSPCEFCTNHIILKESGKAHQWEQYSPALDRYFSVTDRIIRWPDGRDVRFELSIDFTHRKQAENQIRQVNSQLKKALAERDKFFSIIAHDLRSPLMGFLVFIRMLTERIEKLSLEEIQRLAGDMKQSAENLYNLLENLLEWSIIQRGAADYSPLSCCLAEMVKENIELMQAFARHKNVKFICSVPDDLRVFADKSMLKMILRNIFSNAVKFSINNGKVIVSSRVENSMVRLSVEDQGMGMDQKTLATLFALDQMSSQRGTAGEKGTGLGLLLCKEYVNKHGGEIWAESVRHKGTVFHFTLPLESSGNPSRSNR